MGVMSAFWFKYRDKSRKTGKTGDTVTHYQTVMVGCQSTITLQAHMPYSGSCTSLTRDFTAPVKDAAATFSSNVGFHPVASLAAQQIAPIQT